MADLILFHHAQGLTDGIRDFAEELRDAGHSVTVPDLYDGATFSTVEEGVAHAEQIGFDNIVAAGVAAAEPLPARAVFAGFSLGAMPAQKLAQTRPGAAGALIYHSAVPFSAFADAWPKGVDLQVHLNEHDEWNDIDDARELVEHAQARAAADLYIYPGSTHLFSDSSLPHYDAGSAALLMERTLSFLSRLG